MNREGITPFPTGVVDLRVSPSAALSVGDSLTLELLLNPIGVVLGNRGRGVQEGATDVGYDGLLVGTVLETTPAPTVELRSFVGVAGNFLTSSEADVQGYGITEPIYDSDSKTFSGTIRLPQTVNGDVVVLVQIRASVGRYNREDSQIFRIFESSDDVTPTKLPLTTGTALPIRQVILISPGDLHDAAEGWDMRLSGSETGTGGVTVKANTRAIVSFARGVSNYRTQELPLLSTGYFVELRQTTTRPNFINSDWQVISNIQLSETQPPNLAIPTFTITYSEGVFTITIDSPPPTGATGYDIQFNNVEADVTTSDIYSYREAFTPHTVNQSTGTLYVRMRATTTGTDYIASEWSTVQNEPATGFTIVALPALPFTLSASAVAGQFVIDVQQTDFHPQAGTWDYRFAAGSDPVSGQPHTTEAVDNPQVTVDGGRTVATVFSVQVRQNPAATALNRFSPGPWTTVPKTISVEGGLLERLDVLSFSLAPEDMAFSVVRGTIDSRANQWEIEYTEDSTLQNLTNISVLIDAATTLSLIHI